MIDTHFKINTPNVVSEMIDGEVIIIHLEAGNYYSLNNPVGVAIWSGIEAGQDTNTIALALGEFYPEQSLLMDNSVNGFIAQLVSENLIIMDDSARINEVPSESASMVINTPMRATTGVFQAPTLEKFSDMQDLLLLDPIHEVDEAGWPIVQNGNANPLENR